MLEHYLPVLIFLGFAFGFGFVILGVGSFLGPKKPNPGKQASYECGFSAFEEARNKFDVRFYLVAILFIIFDLEVAFLFPWAVVIDQISWAAFWAMAIFFGLLVIGFIYEWKKGALEWE